MPCQSHKHGRKIVKQSQCNAICYTSRGHFPSPQPSHLDPSFHNMPKVCTVCSTKAVKACERLGNPELPKHKTDKHSQSQQAGSFVASAVLHLGDCLLILSYLSCLVSTLYESCIKAQPTAAHQAPQVVFLAPLLRCLQGGRKGQKACHPLHVKPHLRSERKPSFSGIHHHMFTSLRTQFVGQNPWNIISHHGWKTLETSISFPYSQMCFSETGPKLSKASLKSVHRLGLHLGSTAQNCNF